MSSSRIIKCLEWITDLPSVNRPRKSPVFVLNGNEWFIRLVHEKVSDNWYCKAYVELEKKNRDLAPCFVNFQIGFKTEKNVYDKLSLKLGRFKITEHLLIWKYKAEDLVDCLPPDYIMGNYIKFLFCFDEVAEKLVTIFNRVDDKAIQTSSCADNNDKSIQTPSYADAWYMLENASKDFSKLLDEDLNTDVEIICGDQTFKAHKSILSCRSDVFASVFHSDMKEGNTGRVNIQDIDGAIFKKFLRCLYTGTQPELTVDIAVKLYELGDKYNVSSVKKQCADYLTDNLSTENACEILIVADQHSDVDFKKSIMEYIIEQKMPYTAEAEVWADFCKENAFLATEVLNMFCQYLRPK